MAENKETSGHSERPLSAVTLSDLMAERDELREQIKQKELVMRGRVTNLFSPASRTQSVGSSRLFGLLGNIDKILAIYHGVSLGYKIMKQTRTLFGRKR